MDSRTALWLPYLQKITNRSKVELPGTGKPETKGKTKLPKATMDAESKNWMAQNVAQNMDNGNALILVSVVSTSASNMSYSYRVQMVSEWNGKLTPSYLNYWIAAELGESLNRSDNLKGSGCGFDRGFDAVYTIGRILERHGLTENGHTWAANANWRWF